MPPIDIRAPWRSDGCGNGCSAWRLLKVSLPQAGHAAGWTLAADSLIFDSWPRWAPPRPLALERARVIGGVRRNACPQCSARAYGPCQVSPPGDCLARWLAAYTAGKITRADLIGVVGGLVVITAAQLVDERAA